MVILGLNSHWRRSMTAINTFLVRYLLIQLKHEKRVITRTKETYVYLSFHSERLLKHFLIFVLFYRPINWADKRKFCPALWFQQVLESMNDHTCKFQPKTLHNFVKISCMHNLISEWSTRGIAWCFLQISVFSPQQF